MICTTILLVTTVTEVSPPFLGVPQIWRSRSGYKSLRRLLLRSARLLSPSSACHALADENKCAGSSRIRVGPRSHGVSGREKCQKQ